MKNATRRIILDGERPISWNKFYTGKHWSSRKEEADRVHMLVRAAIDPDWEMYDVPVQIRVDVWFKGTQQDASNICAKVYEDALIGWLLEDDDPSHVVSMTTASYKDNRRPRVEITLIPVLPPPF